jgi:diguanylate cyclase (GGDEF)-like protein
MELLWKQIYPAIRIAAKTAESVDALFQNALEAIATVYQAEGLLWTGLDAPDPSALCVYATAKAWQMFDASTVSFAGQTASDDQQTTVQEQELEKDAQRATIRLFRPQRPPDWLIDYTRMPQVVLGDGDEMIASTAPASEETSAAQVSHPVFVLQLKRSPLTFSASASERAEPESAWSAEELESIQVVCGQLELAYSALVWKQQFEHAHQQTALVGRIAHLINSRLNPDEIVRQILAELGQNLMCDRCMVLDLRLDPTNVLATWEPTDTSLKPAPQTTQSAIWRDLVDMFLQGGTSYLDINPLNEDGHPFADWLAQLGAESALVFPLFVLEEFLGAIVLLFDQPNRSYGVQELQVVRQASDQLAIALTNAQHYHNPWYKQEALRLQNNSLQLEIIRDEHTHLLNRHSFENELNQLSTQAVWAIQPPFSILICDIDYFKLVNDTHGHLIGDEVLQKLAHQLQQQLRRGTSLYRFGGEEFAAILSETGLTGAKEVADRLRRTIRATPITTTAGPIDLTLSFGVAEQLPERDRHARDVLHRAEKALYQAKCQGRDRVEAL